MASYWQGPRTPQNIWSRALVEQNSARLASAHHEAGHTVAALHLGRNVHRVTVGSNGGGALMQTAAATEPLPDGTARDFINRLKRSGTTLADDWVRDDLMLTLAGPAAGSRVGGLPLGGSDEDSIRRLIVLLARSEAEALRAFDEAQARARRLVDQYWPVIEDIAHALDEKRELSGDEVREICRRSAAGRELLASPEPPTLPAPVPTKELHYPGGEIRHRRMGVHFTPVPPPPREDTARERRATLERLCAADGYDPAQDYGWWVANILLLDFTPRGGKIYGRA
jgi:hypothetical protein